MIALAWVLQAFAADPVRWVSLPAERLASLGLGSPTISEDIPGLQRYPLATGGLVSLYLVPTADEADRVFERMEHTGATRWPPADQPLPGERAVGDGLDVVLIRDRNAVLFVRDLGGEAGKVASGVLAALAQGT